MTRRICATALLLLPILLAACGETPAENPSLYFQDDFSDPESGWDRVNGADGVTDYSNGAYRLFAALPN